MEPAQILLVEDSVGDAFLVQEALASCPVTPKLHLARDGEQALTMLADPNLKPDLIILDLNLPLITGLGVLKKYHPKDIPVVVFTSSWRQTDKEFALALGASEYIRKPVDLASFTDTVCAIVKKWAGRKESSAALSS
ncbi:MAG TPA: response regulator [Bryobacteraceae bacterium]|nr:response regulator [Bryobacteraceae bacterium]